MLKLIKPKKIKITECDFGTPFNNQKLGLEMLIALNTTDREFLIGPEVGKQIRLIVVKEKPNYLFNPSLDYLDDDETTPIIVFYDYMGNKQRTPVTDILTTALKSLEPTKRKVRKKVNANKSGN